MAATLESLTPQQRERLTLDAIEALENLDAGQWTVADAVTLLGVDDLALGLVLYSNLLEAMLVMTRGADVPAIRASCRTTARKVGSR